jgi:hypothetical protein
MSVATFSQKAFKNIRQIYYYRPPEMHGLAGPLVNVSNFTAEGKIYWIFFG